MRQKISQRQARRLKKRVEELEERVRNVASSGVYLTSIGINNLLVMQAELKVAQKLGFQLIAKYDSSQVNLYAVKL